MRAALPAFAALAATIALGGCQKPKQLYVDHAYVRLAPVPKNPAAAYFTIHGGPADQTLMAISASVAIKTEMHESMNQGGMETMKPIAQLPVPAGSTIAFKPGGRHAMLFDVNPALKPGGNVPLIFTFTNGERIEVDAPAIAAGAKAPA